MARSFFIGLGVFIIVLGLQCVMIDEFRLRLQKTPEPEPTAQLSSRGLPGSSPAEQEDIKLQTPDWAPWTMLSVGTVTIIYAFALPKRFNG